MKSAYLLLPLACAAPVLQSCSTTATPMSGYGLKPTLEARNSSESPEMYYRIGRYWQAQGGLDKAEQAYRRALELKRGYPEAANALATAQALRGDYEDALRLLKTAVEHSPRAAYLHNNLGYLLYLKGEHEAAIPPLERAVALDPAYARAHSNLALAYGKAGQAQRAGEHRSESVRLARLADSLRAPTAAAERSPATRSVLARAGHTGEVPQRATPLAAAAHQDAAPVASALSRSSLQLRRVAPNVYELRVPARETTPPTPPSAQASTVPAAPPAREARPFRLEVANGNGVSGMARRVSDKLRVAGLSPVRLTNQQPYEQRVTEIQYAPGYAAEAAYLAAFLRQRALMIHSDRLRPDIKVRLVLGRDIQDETAFLRLPGKGRGTRLAQSN